VAHTSLLRALAIASSVLVSPFLGVSPTSATTDSFDNLDTVSVSDDGDTNSDTSSDTSPTAPSTTDDVQESGDPEPTPQTNGDAESDDTTSRPSENLDTTDEVLDALAEELAEMVDADTAEALIDDVSEDGTVRVIVTLAVDTKLEASLSRRDMVNQRRAIASAQDDALDDVSDDDVEVIHQLTVVPIMVVDATAEGLLDLIDSDSVESVILDEVLDRAVIGPSELHTANTPGDAPLMSVSLTSQQVTPVHEEGVLGQGGSIAVLDDGVDKNHPFFAQFDENGQSVGSRVVAEACFSTRTSISRSFCPTVNGIPQSTDLNNPNDTDSALPCSLAGCDHGTHVAGIAAGGVALRPNGQQVLDQAGQPFTGVAPEAGIVAVQVFHEQLSPSGGSAGVGAFSSDILTALEWVYRHRNAHNTRVVNMSLGGGRATTQCSAADGAMTGMIRNLLAVGIPTVIASGNNGWSDAVSFPACISEAWAVGATTSDADRVSSFTNTHPTMVNLYAVGSGVLSSVRNGQYAIASGTSMAAPQVAGAVALLRASYPSATPQQLLTALQCTGSGVSLRQNGSQVGFSHPAINVATAHFSPCPTPTPQVTRGNGQATVRIAQAPVSLPAIDRYEARCTAPGQATRTAQGTSTTLTVSSLNNGVSYACGMRAMGWWGSQTALASRTTDTTLDPWSTWSATRSVTPATLPSRPAQPSVTRGNTTARVVVPTPANNGAAITRYQARCSASGQPTRTGTSTSRAVTVTNLRNNVRYSCQTRALNSVGWSTWSTTRAIATVARPSRPARPSVARQNQAARVSVSTPRANGASITRYQARCTARGQATRTATSTTRTVTVRSLRNGTTYSCSIRAQNALGWSSWSTTRNVRPGR